MSRVLRFARRSETVETAPVGNFIIIIIMIITIISIIIIIIITKLGKEIRTLPRGPIEQSEEITNSAPPQGGRGRQASEGRRLRLRGHKPQPRVAKGGQTWPDTLWGQSLL